MRPMSLEVLTSPLCRKCEEFVFFWKEISHEWTHVEMREISLLTNEGQELARRHGIFSAPGIIIDEELIASGGFSKKDVLVRLQELSMPQSL